MRRIREFRGVAQLVEQRPPKPWAEGSNPSTPVAKAFCRMTKGFCFVYLPSGNHMDEVKRYVNIAYIIAAIIMSWFYMNLVAWLMGWIGFGDTRLIGEHVTLSTIGGGILGIITAILLWRHAKSYEGALNVAREMKKVTWPNGDETKHAMKVVIIMALIVAAILFTFDFVAKELTDLILGIK